MDWKINYEKSSGYCTMSFGERVFKNVHPSIVQEIMTFPVDRNMIHDDDLGWIGIDTFFATWSSTIEEKYAALKQTKKHRRTHRFVKLRDGGRVCIPSDTPIVQVMYGTVNYDAILVQGDLRKDLRIPLSKKEVVLYLKDGSWSYAALKGGRYYFTA